MIFKAPPQLEQCSMPMSKTRFFEEPDDCAGKRAGAAIKARSKGKAITPLIFSASMVRFNPNI
jgi:hypothetical protein